MSKMKLFNGDFLNAVLYLLVGILFCVFRAEILGWLFTAIGVLFVVQGIMALVRRDTVGGAVGLVIGILLLIFAWSIGKVVLIVFGVLMIVKGVISLLSALQRRPKPHLMAVLMSGLTVFVGVMLIVSGGTLLNWLFVVIGVFFIVDAVLSLLAALRA